MAEPASSAASSSSSLPSAASALGATTADTVHAPGHLGNLSAAQTSALAALWLRVLDRISQPPETPIPPSSSKDFAATTADSGKKDKKKSNPSSKTATPTASTSNAPICTAADLRAELWLAAQDHHVDAFLLRFLRARKFDVPAAEAMLVDALRWRVLNNAQGTLEHGDALVEANQFSSGKCFWYQTDLQGRPIIYINVKAHERGANSLEQLERHTVYMMETTRLLLTPGSAETVTIVFNMTGFSMANADLDMVKFLVNCLQNYYPESLGACLVVNAPWLFHGIWKLIKPWLDPVVQAKVAFIKPAELATWIDPQRTPAFIDGKDPYAFAYWPPSATEIADHNKRLAEHETIARMRQAVIDAAVDVERATRTWARAYLKEVPHPAAPATTNLDEEVDMNSARAEIEKARLAVAGGVAEVTPLARAWREYDDFVRFPSQLHRAGVIVKGSHKVDWTKAPTPEMVKKATTA
ncbi:hypothetical protein GGF31_000193 [Allomyces arbusculus]|nr:hypothetical protein GGF31_000193 [Allomyces arbusculus]